MYLLFSGLCNYPSPGADDYVKDFDSVEDAVSAYEKLNGTYYEWANVFCTETKQKVAYTNYRGDKWVFIGDKDF